MNKDKSSSSTDFNSLISRLQDFLSLYFVKKAPALPENAKEIIVKFAPYVSIVAVVMSALGLLSLNFIFIGTAFSSLSILVWIISLIFEGLSIPGLFSRKISGWNFVFYGVLTSALYFLITFNLVNLVIGSAISLYLIFQVKSYYK